MSSVYEPQKLKEEAVKNMMIVETAINVEALIKLLVSKGIIANVEMDYIRSELKSSPKYKAVYEMYQQMINAAEVYEKDPQRYLQELLKAKLNGTIR